MQHIKYSELTGHYYYWENSHKVDITNDIKEIIKTKDDQLLIVKQKLKTVRKQFREHKREEEPKSGCCGAGFYETEDGKYCGECDGDGRDPSDYNEGCCGANCDDYTCDLCQE